MLIKFDDQGLKCGLTSSVCEVIDHFLLSGGIFESITKYASMHHVGNFSDHQPVVLQVMFKAYQSVKNVSKGVFFNWDQQIKHYYTNPHLTMC